MKNMTGIWRMGFVILVGLCVVACTASTSYSLPQVDKVQSGTADFKINANTMTINASDKAIVNYKSFDILQNETVIINLPSSNNAILNRVIGNSPSQILGRLDCNGTLFLINTNGINIGSGAQINVGSLVLSTRDITNTPTNIYYDQDYCFCTSKH